MSKVTADDGFVFFVTYFLSDRRNSYRFYSSSYIEDEDKFSFERTCIDKVVRKGDGLFRYSTQLESLTELDKKQTQVYGYIVPKPDWYDIKIDDIERDTTEEQSSELLANSILSAAGSVGLELLSKRKISSLPTLF